MLTDAPVTTILPVNDLSRAAAFYRDQLGLEDLGESPGGNWALRTTAGARIELMAAEQGAQSKHTVISFEVEDLGGQIVELEGKGVKFEDYDEPFKTTGHVATIDGHQAAWFTDTEGNFICLHHEAPS
ncbi:VOC family protein [Phytoactinopolyspora endophytica]|uniref:VOC family protein n=1 Tax=Phytoactinopolyspora endophytica TaxID=1642495 RepID=UPI00101CDAD0|nr:VOC family protein [Phytoactinopolyspora endophytica]